MRFFKKYWILLLPLLLFVVWLVFVSSDYSQVQYYRPSGEISEADLVSDEAVAVKWRENELEGTFVNVEKPAVTSSGNGIVLRESAKLYERATIYNLQRNTLRQGEYWYVTAYDVTQKGTPSRQIDIMQTVRDYDEDYYPNYILLSGGYILISVWKETKPYSSFLVVDGRSCQVVSMDKDAYVKRQTSFLTNTSLADKFNELGLYLSADRILITNKNRNIIDKLQIAEKYPDVGNNLKSGGRLYLLTSADSKDRDKTAEVLQLFSPEGEDIFDGVTIEAESTVDGKEHTVKSYAEFKQYYKETES